MDGVHEKIGGVVLFDERRNWFGMIQDGDLEKFRSYIARGGNYRAKYSGHTPLFLACIEGHTHLATYISTLPGVDFHEKCMGVDSFYAACQSGCVDLVEFLLSLNVYNINLRQVEGCTAFFVACKGNHLALVKLLLDNGAQVDIPDEDDNSPLLSAVATGKLELFLLLLEHGARPTLQALEFAKLAGRSQMRKILEEKLGTKIPKEVGIVKHCCQCLATETKMLKMLMCARCQNASYCSEECQKAAWPQHKVCCKPITTTKKSTGTAEVSADDVARAAAAEAELLGMLDEEEAIAEKKKAGKSTKKKK